MTDIAEMERKRSEVSYKSLNKEYTYFVTGAAGFIGYHLSAALLAKGCRVIGMDNINDYYDINLKFARLNLLKPYKAFTFIKGDISDKDTVNKAFKEYKPDMVINLAAQAGVRYSINHPDVYIQSNIIGFYNILEACRYFPVKHLVYASSSSVYGSNTKVPFEESDFVDHPVSLYAATKKSNELMACSYSHLYKISATGLRLFTVYGPLGRPDMAYFSFADKYFDGEPIRIFNNGDFNNDLYRDFTYIDDIVEGIIRLLGSPLKKIDGFAGLPETTESPLGAIPHRIFNIGNSNPVKLMTFIETLEKCLSKATGREILFSKTYGPVQPGDIPVTFASTDLLNQAVGFKPQTPIESGLQRFADWYVGYYHKK